MYDESVGCLRRVCVRESCLRESCLLRVRGCEGCKEGV